MAKMKIARADLWAATIKDKVGGLDAKLAPLSAAGANFQFVFARRQPEKRGKVGVVFVAPLKGAKQMAAARKAGFKKTKSLHAVRIDAANRPRLAARILAALTEAEISLRGFSGAAVSGKAMIWLAFDTTKDAAKAIRVLKAL